MEEKSKKSLNMWIITVVAAAIFAIGGFIVGTKYQQSRVGNFSGRFGANGIQQRGGTFNRGNGFRPVAGEVLSSDEKSITVKMTDDSTKIVLLGDSTTYSKFQDGSKTDLTNGTQVAVFGTENSDGSVTAQNVQINPQFRINVGENK